ncbi:HNH endonuclease [Aureivirga marina]|uniref:HNH endonuclease n=1 Tax=Aureivirga marina TaxID=1182451 RepID=UPI0018C941CF|nr:HNH endonuclease [Aureivirga marina]
MPDITIPVTFTPEQQSLINSKLNDPDFTHQHWGNDDLLDLRRHIRNHYRGLSGFCSYCKNEVSISSASNAHIEHIIPKSQIPKFIFTPKNLCVVCCDCNEIKKNKIINNELENPLSNENRNYIRYPNSSNSFKIVHPHFDNYNDHIAKNGNLYIDLSDKGSFTIYICRLNRRAHEYGLDGDLTSHLDAIRGLNILMDNDDREKDNSIISRFKKLFGLDN